MKEPKLPKGYSQYGAQMGRCNNITEPDFPVKFRLYQLRLDNGGYDNAGAYWGHGEPLYRAFGDGAEEVQEVFIRALSRENARGQVRKWFPNCKFYR